VTRRGRSQQGNDSHEGVPTEQRPNHQADTRNRRNHQALDSCAAEGR
jgi:hypothetical protein